MNIPDNSVVVSKIIEIINNPNVEISADTKFFDIPNMDSLNTMDVINDIEDYYDVVVNIHYVDWVLTVNDLASLVIEEIKKQP